MAESQTIGVYPPLPWGRREVRAMPIRKSFPDIIREKHEQAGLAFPLNGPWLEDRGALAKVVSSRISKEANVRKAVAFKAQEVYGPHSDEAHALGIFREIAQPIDEIFVSQLKTYRGEPLSWQEANRGASLRLTSAVSKIQDNPQYADFFRRYPETLQALVTLASRVVSEANPETLASLSKELEHYTFETYKKGGPIFAFSLSQFYANPKEINDKHPKVLDARAQLVFPPSSDMRTRYSTLVQAAWDGHQALSSVNEGEKPLGNVFGIAVGWAGSELVSYTTGEQLTGERCLVLLANLFKRKDIRDLLFARAGLTVPKDIDNYLLVQYVLHETGHDFDKGDTQRLEEIITDIPSMIAGLEMVRDQDPAVVRLGVTDLKTYIATQIFDLSQQVLDEYTDPSVQGYYVSSYFLLDRLFQHQILQINDDGQSISIDAAHDRVNTFINDLRSVQERLEVKDKDFIDELQRVNKTDQINTLFRLLKQDIPLAKTQRLLQLLGIGSDPKGQMIQAEN